jgi:K+-sensing histidine kinase KdpD
VLLGGIALSLLTWFGFWLKLNLPTAAFAYLILIVLMSLRRDRGASIILTLAAAGCLNYFFAPPTFTLWIESPSDATVVMAFLTSSLISSTLLGRSRRRTEEAIAPEKHWRQRSEPNKLRRRCIRRGSSFLMLRGSRPLESSRRRSLMK